MRFLSLKLDGYGKFVGREIALQPGLQIVLGPNEQGKSTLCRFIGHMLYGQKRSETARLYEDEHELRKPWQPGAPYGGRIVYEIDRGERFEVARNFSKRDESVSVFSLTHGEEVTARFERQRNREPLFAEAHLGLTKAVFLHTATISYLSLDGLGDEDALGQIREKLLSLADSGDEEHSAETALAFLDERIRAIGRPGVHSKRPLPTLRARLAELDDELRAVRALQAELAESERERLDLAAGVEAFRLRRHELQAAMKDVDRAARARQLAEAERLTERLGKATKHCFALSAARDFPLEKSPDVQRLDNRVATARAQLERTEAELDDLAGQMDAESGRAGHEGLEDLAELDEGWEARLADSENRLAIARKRYEDAEASLAAAQSRAEEAKRQLDALPDFSTVAGDPMEWLNQMASTFELKLRTRDAERKERARLEAEVKKWEESVALPSAVFTDDSLVSEMRARDDDVRLAEQRREQALTRLEMLRATLGEHQADLPGHRMLALLLAAIALGCLFASYYRDDPGLTFPGLIAGLGVVYFFGKVMTNSAGARRARIKIGDVQAELASIEAGHASGRGELDALLGKAQVDTVREMEALFERFSEERVNLDTVRAVYRDQAERAREEEEHVAALFASLRETFAALGETLRGEEEVSEAAMRTVSRYQQYRDAKRRYAENRDQAKQREEEFARLTEEVERLREEDAQCCLAARRLLRDAGFADEKKHASANSAFRAYRIRFAHVRQRRGRVDVLSEKREALTRRRELERADLEKQDRELKKCLANVGVDSIEGWRALETQAREYKETWAERTKLQEQIDALLQGLEIEALRARVAADGAPAGPVGLTEEAIEEELARVASELEGCEKREHALKLRMTERLAGARSLNEIEEERAALEARARALEIEVEAAGYAASLIEAIARDKHAQIAPRLAALASAYLKEITAGAYDELGISRDLRLTIRIPETAQLNEDPERRLSTGTVDQIYLALRLAMVQSLGETGETIPMLLDDPFSNYDDERLAHALTLLMRLGERAQIVLFTCRDDVGAAARKLGAPIIDL